MSQQQMRKDVCLKNKKIKISYACISRSLKSHSEAFTLVSASVRMLANVTSQIREHSWITITVN